MPVSAEGPDHFSAFLKGVDGLGDVDFKQGWEEIGNPPDDEPIYCLREEGGFASDETTSDSDEKVADKLPRRGKSSVGREKDKAHLPESLVSEELRLARKISNDRLKTIFNLRAIEEDYPHKKKPTIGELKEEVLKAVSEEMDLPESSFPAISEHLQKYGITPAEIDEMGPTEMYDRLLNLMAFDHLIVSMTSSTGGESNFARRYYHGQFKTMADFEKYEFFGVEITDVAEQLTERVLETFEDEDDDPDQAEITMFLDDGKFSRVIERHNEMFPEDPVVVVKGYISYNNLLPCFWPGLSFRGKYGGSEDTNVMVYRLKDRDDGLSRTKITS